jgi:hypothetical protein
VRRRSWRLIGLDLTIANVRRAGRDAAAVIDVLHQHGWCQHVRQSADGRVCLDEALMQAPIEEASQCILAACGAPIL